METVLTIILAMFLLSSCAPLKAKIGMHEGDFRKFNKSAELVKLSTEGDIYKMLVYQNGRQSYRFFYFFDGKLGLMDEGVKRADVVIQNIN